MAIQNTLSELVHHLRSGAFSARSPPTYPPSFQQQSPSMTSPSVSTPTSHQQASPQSASTAYASSHGSVLNIPQARPSRASLPAPTYQSPPMIHSTQSVPPEELNPPQLSPAYGNLTSGAQNFNIHPHPHPQPSQGPILPPFSSIQTMGPPVPQQSHVTSPRYQSSDSISQRVSSKFSTSASKRHAPSSNVTSADSSDLDDEDNGELPAQGLVAPWEVLRGLADVAIERAAKVRLLICLTISRCQFGIRKPVTAVNRTVGQGLPHQNDTQDLLKEGKYAIGYRKV